MKPRRFDKDMYVRTTREAKMALNRVVAELKFSEVLTLQGKPTVSQEAILNASWLWMLQIIELKGVKALEKELAPAFDRLNRILDELEAKAAREAAKEKRAAGGKKSPKAARHKEGFTKPKSPKNKGKTPGGLNGHD